MAKKAYSPKQLEAILEKDILYTGVHIQVELIRRLLKALGVSEQIISEIKPELHMTVKFRPSLAEIKAAKFGEIIRLRLTHVGELWKGGVLMNFGLKVEDETGLSSNKIAHVTCWINQQAGAKAVETAKCSWVKLEEDVTIEGTMCAFDGRNNWSSVVVE